LYNPTGNKKRGFVLPGTDTWRR